MATVTGSNILDSVLDTTGVTLPDTVKLIISAKLQQMIDAGFGSGLNIALMLSASSSAIRAKAPVLLNLATVVEDAKTAIEDDGAAETLTGGSGDDILTGGSMNDRISGHGGNDIIRGGAGVDEIYAGDGDDKIVIVGDLSGGGKIDTDEDTAILGFPLTDLNFKNLNEDEDGAAEVIIGGEGDDTLYVYGTADLSNFTMEGVEHIEIRSDVTFSNDVLEAVSDINGDGSSTIRIVGKTLGTPVAFDLAQLNLSDIGHIELSRDVTLKIDSLDQLGGCRILTGGGTIIGKEGFTIVLPDTYTIETGLKVKNDDGNGGLTDAVVNAQILDNVINGQAGNIITGSAGNDYLIGTDTADIFDGGAGNDVMTGKGGDDIFKVTAGGEKIIIDDDTVNNSDTLDLSGLNNGSGAIIDMTTGGNIGTGSTIQLGASNAGGATGQIGFKSNVMLIIDVSGSMRGSRLAETKAAAIKLLDAYDAQGDVAVRIVKFSSSASSSFNGADTWTDIDTAKNIINGLSARGGTDYNNAMDKAREAFLLGQGSEYLTGGSDVSYFLSDGDPDSSVSSREDSWENFLIDNKIISHAIGFGGLSSTHELEPWAFDGTKVVSSTDDHTPGEIPASIEVDTTNLGNTLIDTAKLAFLENITGTDFDDIVTGNNLDNLINGGAGNDKVVFAGNKADYAISVSGNSLVVEDTDAGRDGKDTLVSVEVMGFADQEVPTSDYFNPVELSTSDELFKLYHTQGIGNSDGYFKLFFDLSSASYVHIDALNAFPGMHAYSEDDTKTNSYKTLKRLSDNNNIHFLDKNELNLGSTGIDGLSDFKFEFEDGYYIAYTTEGLERSSAAMVGRTKDALFITFRGTDNSLYLSDWSDDFLAMGKHYDRYKPLLDAVDDYVETEGISKVYVSGHSLGGQMAMYYMETHPNTSGVDYEAVTFEAANKFVSQAADGSVVTTIPDNRFTNFEMRLDPVPDLDTQNYGKTIFLEYHDNNILIPASTHGLSSIAENAFAGASLSDTAKAFSEAVSIIDRHSPALNQRVYVDYDNNHIIESIGTGYTTDCLNLLYAELVAAVQLSVSNATSIMEIYDSSREAGGTFLEIISNAIGGTTNLEDAKLRAQGAIQDFSDNVVKNLATIFGVANEAAWNLITAFEQNEIRAVGYDFKTLFSTPGGTLVLNPIESATDNTFRTDDDNIKNIIIKGEIDFDEDINVIGGINTEILTGNAGKNTLDISNSLSTGSDHFIAGGAGSDTIIGSNHTDILFGDDYYKAFKEASLSALTDDKIQPHIEWSVNTDPLDYINTSLFSYNDTLAGGGGNDFIAGGLGNDRMEGNTGDDTFLVENQSDEVIEKPGEGFDTAIIFTRFADDQITSITSYDNVESIILADDTFTMSENISIVTDPVDDLNRIIVGNAGNNVLHGGAGKDILIGGADKDILFGGDGDDELFGGKYEDIKADLASPLTADLENMINKFANGMAIDDEDLSFLRGGSGKDILHGTEGDNDFFLIDVNLGDNSNNVDTIKGFYIASALSNPFKEDYLVFSAEQLGTTVGDLEAIGPSAKTVNGKTAHHVSSLNFLGVNGISDYQINDGLNTSPQFVLDYSAGDLFFDPDGSHDIDDLVRLANIREADGSTKVSDNTFDADQILVMGNADFLSVSDAFA